MCVCMCNTECVLFPLRFKHVDIWNVYMVIDLKGPCTEVWLRMKECSSATIYIGFIDILIRSD